MPKAVTHYAFRNGPVEDMHTEKKLTQDDMRTLNKYMVNRLAGLFSLMLDGQWAKLMAVYEHCYKRLGKDWDPAEPDTAEIEALFELFCLDMKDGEND